MDHFGTNRRNSWVKSILRLGSNKQAVSPLSDHVSKRMSLISRLLGSLQRVGEERKSGSRHTRRAVGFELHETPVSTFEMREGKGEEGT